ncbi:hypothetical protein MBLNU459_g0216t1 [Dothideomycetes sp. NU459]
MFAARADQENFVHGQQQAAAAKPLNQGLRGLGAKTPGNKAPKTPFRRPQGDENDDFGARTGLKTAKKGGDTLFTKTQKGADVDKNAFVTPAGPRNRAPLGMKTTNAKAGLLKTPTAQTDGKSAQKTVSPRLRRAKVKIHQADTVRSQAQTAEPDIEYMAPRSVPLPDYPDTLHEQNWSMLQGDNLTNGWWGAFSNPPGEDGVTRAEREEAEMHARAAKAEEDIVKRALDADLMANFDLEKVSRELEAKKKKAAAAQKAALAPRAPSTLASKRAAAALSRPEPAASSKPSAPRFAAPTATVAARSRAPAPAALASRKPSSATAATAGASSKRHVVASAASRSTLGYSAGRAVSATARQPLSSIYDRKPSSPAVSKQVDLLESLIADDPELEELLRERNGAGDGDDDDDEGTLVGTLGSVKLVEDAEDDDDDDELKDFQLVMPEL